MVLDNGSLRLSNVTKMDAGIYTCVARNQFGVASSSGSLFVKGKFLNWFDTFAFTNWLSLIITPILQFSGMCPNIVLNKFTTPILLKRGWENLYILYSIFDHSYLNEY